MVIEKLNKVYGRFFRLAPILWELEPMLASGHFQDQITPPSDADIVVLIVWSRLGTSLPPRTATREYRGIDGRVPVTGTEWEFEDAVAAQQRRGAPDLLAYRKLADPVVSLKDKAAKALAEAQWEKLEGFWNRWFVDRGEFRAAFSQFAELDAFETQLERDLKSLIERRIEDLGPTGRDAPSVTWLAGSPFRGLETYRYEHAPVFFGRSAMTRAAVEQLAGNAERGRAFLLVLGASGAGKSSLVQAGLLPAVTGRGIVPGVGLWRRAVLRPGGDAQGPFAALAQALAGEAALPELLSQNQDAAALARYLAAAADDPTFPIVTALNRIEETVRKRGDLLAIETVRLALIVDQLEEMFTADVTPEARDAFIRCLDALARSGRVFVVATMRSDFWHRAAETPLLVDMATGVGRLDLLPPAPDEILEMIRQPAQAAGLVFERDPARDTGLDATLASEAEREPGALPLLSFLLDELYERDVAERRGTALTFDTMRALGGLKGAIANRAEAVFARLTPEVQAALPRVLRALVTVSGAGAGPTARAVPLAAFGLETPDRQLVEALLDPRVRLLVAEGDGSSAQVRIAHEALITHWQRAASQIAQDMDDLRTRATLEEAVKRWTEAKTKRSGYLLRDPALANARDLAGRWRGELGSDSRVFIQASHRRARWTQRMLAAAVVLFALLGASAGVLAMIWQDASRTALRNEARAVEALGRVERLNVAVRRNETHALAAMARVAADNGRADLGVKLALAAWPGTANDSRPQLESTLQALSRAVSDAAAFDVVLPHDAPIWGADLSQEHKRVVTRSTKGRIRAWDVRSGQLLGPVIRHANDDDEDPLRAGGAALTADGRQIVSWTNDIRVWDIATGHQTAPAMAHGRWIQGIVQSRDGKYVLAWAADDQLRLWDRANGRQIGPAMAHPKSVLGAAFMPDEKHIVSWSNDGVRLWNMTSGQISGPMMRHPIRGATLSPQRDRILTFSSTGTVRVWDLASGAQVGADMRHTKSVAGALFSGDGGRILSWSDDGTARLWNAASGQQIGAPMNHAAPVRGAHPLRHAPLIVSWTAERIWFWNAETGARDGDSIPTGAFIDSLTVTNDGLIVAAFDKSVETWNASTRAKAQITTVKAQSAQVAADGVSLLIWSKDGALHLRDRSRPGATLRRLTPAADLAGPVLSEDQTRMLLPNGNSFRLYDIPTGERRGPPLVHDGPVADALFAPNGRVLSWASDGVMRLWDVATGQPIGAPMPHRERIRGAAFAPDGRTGLSWSDEGVRFWDLTTGQSIGAPLLHNDGAGNRILNARYASDGRRMVSVSLQTLRVWDVASREQLGGTIYHGSRQLHVTLDQQAVLAINGLVLQMRSLADGAKVGPEMRANAGVKGAEIAEDGRRLLTWSDNDTIEIWDVATGQRIGPVMRHPELSEAMFSADGHFVLSRGGHAVRLWDPETAQLARPELQHPDAKVDGALFLGDTRVISWTDDGMAWLWDIETAQQIGPPMRHRGDILGAEPLQKGKALMSWEAEGVYVWDLDWSEGSLLEISCVRLANRETGEIGRRYGVSVSRSICDGAGPARPDWKQMKAGADP